MERMRRAIGLGLVLLWVATLTGAREQARQPEKRWESAIQAFERQDAEAPPPKHATLFVGSSSIRKWDLSKSFPKLRTINRGFGGSQVADSLEYADRIILKYEPKIVVVYAGDNDIAAGKTPEQVLADFKALVAKTHKRLPDSKIYYIAIKPSVKRWELWPAMRDTNERIAHFAAKTDRVTFVDIAAPMLAETGKPDPGIFAEDGLHLNDKGYEMWAGILMPYLKAAGAPKKDQ